MMNLSRLNLNLLPGLKALLDTQSVSKAAKQMCVTQSAMSRTLAQLREALNDPILVRNGNTIFLSEKALSLKGDVDRVVHDACSIFENQQFEPATTQRTFSIASGLFSLEHVMPGILSEIWEVAPQLNFELIPMTMGYSGRLISGDVDLVIGHADRLAQGLCYKYLTTDRLCVAMDKNHPCAERVLDEAILSEFPLIRDNSWLNSFQRVDDYLNTLAIDYRICAKAPSLAVAIGLLKHTQNFLLTTSSAHFTGSEGKDIILKDLPGNVPQTDYYIAWPEYWEHNRAHRWFREFVSERIEQILQEKIATAPADVWVD